MANTLPASLRDVPTPQSLLDEDGAAAYIGMSSHFLRAARIKKRGPPFLRLGRSIRYTIADLDAWLAKRRVATRD